MSDAPHGLHEAQDEMSRETMDRHRALVSLQEELEAVDWYDQRIDAARDDELKAVLAHNRDEEKEHAAMLLEWLRRRDDAWDKELRDYLFTTRPLSHPEAEDEESAADGTLGLGSLRKEAEDE